MKSYIPELNTVMKTALLAGLALLTIAVSLLYGPLGIHNPFYILSCFLSLHVFLFGVTRNFEEEANPEFKRCLTFGPLKAGTAVLLVAFAIPQGNLLVSLIVVGTTGWLLLSGGKEVLNVASVGVMKMWDNISDQRAFSNEMKEVAHAARVEETLSADLAEFLIDTDSTGKQES